MAQVTITHRKAADGKDGGWLCVVIEPSNVQRDATLSWEISDGFCLEKSRTVATELAIALVAALKGEIAR